jgi:hypothetical protein
MTTVTQKEAKKKMKADALAKDIQRANELINAYANLKTEEQQLTDDLTKQLAPFQAEFDTKTKSIRDLAAGKITSVTTSAEAAAKELLEIAARNRRKLFALDNNWKFENGWYVHVKTETVAKPGENFNLSKFIKKFADYVNIDFKIKELKALFNDGDARVKSKIADYDFDLEVKDKSFEIKESKKEK